MLDSRFREALTGLVVATLLFVIPLSPLLAADPAVEARLARIERMLNERSLSDLVLQIQQLQQEMQDLRGQVETQQYLLRQQGIMAPSSFGAETTGSGSFGREARSGDARSLFGTSDLFNAGVRTPGSGTIDPFAAGSSTGTAEGTSRNATEAFELPGQATGLEQQPSSPSSTGMLALPAPETVAGGERDLYRDAFELLKARDYAAARTAFNEMVERYPQGQFADNGRYWLGEIGYVTQDYASAKNQFALLVSNYPLSPKVPSAMLKLGYVAYEQDELSDARSVLEEVVQRFPESTEARLAQGRLDRMQRERQ